MFFVIKSILSAILRNAVAVTSQNLNTALFHGRIVFSDLFNVTASKNKVTYQ